jgi:hypothetical protein
MTQPPELPVTHAYTRQAVEEYLQSVTAQRAELEAAIAHARARTARATDLTQRVEALEHRVGEWIVGAHAQAAAPHRSPAAPIGGSGGGAPPSTPPPPPPPPPPSSWAPAAGAEADRG